MSCSSRLSRISSHLPHTGDRVTPEIALENDMVKQAFVFEWSPDYSALTQVEGAAATVVTVGSTSADCAAASPMAGLVLKGFPIPSILTAHVRCASI